MIDASSGAELQARRITLLSIENLLTGNVWRFFMRNPYIQNAMERVGFRISTPGNGIREVRTGARHG